MKITINHANSNDSYVIEGTTDELNTIISRVISNPNSVVSSKPIKPAKLNSDLPVNNNSADNVAKFIKSVYLFPSDNNTPTGKGRYIAEILCDFKPHTFSEIEKKSNSITKTVNRNIAKLRAAGAKININGQTVQLVSIPDKRYIVKRRKPSTPPANSSFAAIAGMKLS